MIALNPSNGEIYCLIGGRSYETRRGLNRATQMKRQPGSAFKPISVYAAAVDFLGYTPVSMIEDRVRDFGGGYSPSNASGKEYGYVTLRQALLQSMNPAAVDLITRTGIEAAQTYARRAGIELNEQDANLSLALGSLSEGVSPAQLGAAYAALANGGRAVSPHVIRRIEDLYGRVLYEYEEEERHVMQAQSAYMITNMLRDAVQSGTAKRLRILSFPTAAKTGTVGYPGGGNRDAWTAAYTPTVSVVVWQGFDRPDKEHILPEGMTGGTLPAQLAAAFLQETAFAADGGEFPVPEGMREVLLDASTLGGEEGVMLASERTPKQYLLTETLPETSIPLLKSNRWEAPVQVEAIYVYMDRESGCPTVSFVVPDSFSEYRIIRANGNEETEVGVVRGNAGSYASFVDRQAGNRKDTGYYIISRHIARYELGERMESAPSAYVEYRAPGVLERLIEYRQEQQIPEENALFGM